MARLNQAINVAASAKVPQEKFAATGLAIDPGTPAQLERCNEAETVKRARVTRGPKIELQQGDPAQAASRRGRLRGPSDYLGPGGGGGRPNST
jgi:hypothetical protein